MKQPAISLAFGILAFTTITATADQVKQLWTVDSASEAVASTEEGIRRTQPVSLDRADLNAVAVHGAELTLPGFDDAFHTGIVAKLAAGTNGNRIISGPLNDTPGQFIMVSDDDSFFAEVRTPTEVFHVRSMNDGTVQLQEIDASQFPPCATTEAEAIRAPQDEQLPAGDITLGGGTELIDVLVVYTVQARNAAGGTNNIESLIDMAMAQTNNAYIASEINVQVALVHVEEVNYTESGSMSTDLSRLRGQSDGFMDNVHLLRDVYGADLVALISNTGGACGIGYRMSSLSPGFESNGFTVTRRSCAVGNITFAHELGHNQGCHHDRDNAGGAIYPYAYGYRAPGAAFRTIMAYSPGTRVPHFSNPDVTYFGQPTGNPLGQSDQTHNALTINNTAGVIADFRAAELVDCNNNGTHDALDIFDMTSMDCNGNNVPDECDEDCNNNGIPDQCDLNTASSADCNLNGIPDECDIAAGVEIDCNANGVPDACDLAFLTSFDCDENNVPDECDIVANDCNANGIPDACDLAAEFVSMSPIYSPFGVNDPHQYVVSAPPEALGSVTLRLEARGDLNISTEYVTVLVNGNDVGDAFATGFPDCAEAFGQFDITVPAVDYNGWAASGSITIDLVPSSGVSAAICDPPSQILVTLIYPAESELADNNMNGIPDECETLTGDMNCDGLISVSDIGPFVLAITDAAGYAAQYPDCNILNADASGDGMVTVSDIGGFVALVAGG